MSRVLTHREISPRRPDCLAGAGGFEPPHGGIKIRCLAAWRSPNTVLPRLGPAALDHKARRDAPVSFAQRLKIFRFTAGFGGSGGFPSRRIQQWDLILCGSTDGGNE